jgi:hypothetical protein
MHPQLLKVTLQFRPLQFPGHLEIVRHLVSAGANANAPAVSEGFTALQTAVRCSRVRAGNILTWLEQMSTELEHLITVEPLFNLRQDTTEQIRVSCSTA